MFLRSAWAVGEMLFSGKPRPGADDGWLILPRLDGIGDFWLWLPFVSSLKKVFPHRKLHLLANVLWAEPAQLTGLFDRVTPLSPQKLLRSPAYRRQIWALLKTSPPGFLLHTTFRRRIAVEDSLAWFYPASKRYTSPRTADALESPLVAHYLDTVLYDRAVRLSQDFSHQWEGYQAFLSHLGYERLDYTIYIKLKAIWPGPTLKLPERYLVFLPGAGAAYRKPDPSLVSRLLQTSWERLRIPFLILGTLADRPYVQQAVHLLPCEAVYDLLGYTSLVETLSLITRAEAVIGPETGLTHAAATWDRPTLILMGGGHWGRFFPYPESFSHQPFILRHPMPCYGCGWFCQYTLSRDKPYPCMAALAQASMEPFYQWLSAISARRTE